MRNVNELIKQERIKRGWTQLEMSKRFGCCQTFISKIENEKRGCPQWIIDKCGEIFGKDFIGNVATAKNVYIENINNMLKGLGTDKLRSVWEVVKWAYFHGVVR